MTPLKKTFVHAALSGILFATCIIASVFLGSNTPVGKIILVSFVAFCRLCRTATVCFVSCPYDSQQKSTRTFRFGHRRKQNGKPMNNWQNLSRIHLSPFKQNNAVAVLLCQYLEGTSPLTKNEAYAVLAGNNSLIFVSQDPDDVLLILRFSGYRRPALRADRRR